ncbi:hypothetical protein HYPSUDRAFT_140306 [Hypholoma sublateritium FD-334 SS-4]|uniref:Eukaryotic translation initiation factor 5B n=1 Tax=Hypholoma sublateritium (strain FD-334 SS-4) TaxID=945553 RepID=A0A0D2NSC2_HYPSF|nr:hypothetical protein HYPSUDRAFT_140306 [Hypholoma sublateritium FD-334 SS-4]
MPPKNKGKKGGKKGDDDFWDKAGEAVQPNALASGGDAAPEDEPSFAAKPKAGGFAALAADGFVDDAQLDDIDDGAGGGLMSLISSGKGKKKEKKKAKPAYDDFDDEVPAEATESKNPVEVTAEDLADEEWGPVKDKKKKDKKGKGKKGKQQDGNEDEEKEAGKEEEGASHMMKGDAAPAAAATSVDKDEGDNEEVEEPGTKVLSKKEKEKLKKEREKVAAQAAAKKATEDADAPPPSAVPEPVAPAQAPAAADDEEEGEEAGAGSKADAKKKKKKKAAKKDDEPAAAPAAAAGTKKKGGAISALKALMDEKKRIEEEARQRAEEERKRIEEEERREAEEERKREEEKQRRKEKEKAKRELAKKEGRLLTKKQKEEKQMADIRKQALLASGVQIEGLQQASGSAPPAAKKVVYGNRKKKGPGAKDVSPAPESRPRSPEPVPVAPVEPAETNDAKSDWDADSDKDEPQPQPQPAALADVKDDWDASSDEEKDAPPPPKAAPIAKPVDAKAIKAAPAPAKAPAAKPANGKAAPPAKAAQPESSESESESESEEDSDDSDDSEEDSDESSSDEELTAAQSAAQKVLAQKKAEAAARRNKAREDALAARSKENLRSPICCILGHVDTGKTKLLDKIRQTNVQEGEAGGITQQIGATYFPLDAIKTKTAVLNKDGSQEYNIPGLLVIDTPGHESFTNLRSRGSSLCNIAILVVDIMHGLEAQTLESLRLLRDRKTPFIVALNKIDRMYGWTPTPDGAFQESLAKQARTVQREFEDRVAKTIVAFAEEGLNACLYYENKNLGRNVSLVPTSAITGEGIPDMIMLLVNLTQQRMTERLMYLSELECTVLEVKVIEGLGTTIDVVLSNGILREGDRIVVCGLNGPIVTQVRALLTPQPMRELRIKSAYVHHKEVKAALGVKITAPDLEKAIAGSRLLVVGPDDDEEELKEDVMGDLTTLFENIDKSGRGVCVQASTLGSLEALLDFLKSSKIPVSGINIGPVFKRDVMRAATMLEKAKELACILCFDVVVDKEAERLADEMGIRLFKADIIYHLFDAFKVYNAEITEAKRKDAAPQAVWPCRLKTIAAFCKRDPIILGVDILDGTLRIGTPLSVVKIDPVTGKKDIIDLGKITSLEINHKNFDIVKKSQAGGGVAVKIEHAVYQSAKMFGRHFDEKDELLSHITRQSIDVLKTSFKADVSNDEWLLIRGLKTVRHHSTSYTMSDSNRSSKEHGEAAVFTPQDQQDQDELQLENLGYTQQLHRTWALIESFAASFCALNFIGGVRSAIFLGLLAGGPAAIWSSYLITIVFMLITAAVLAEICSALPLSGSIYIWAAESAGPKYARFFGFVVAWWSCTAWMTFAAGNCQTTANYIVSQLAVWEIDFPGGITNDNVKWRALIWAISEALLIVSVAINYLPPKYFSFIFRFSIFIMMLDFFLCLIWLPIGVSKTYGFRPAKEVFTMTYNGTGAPAGWNWILSFLFTAGTMTGFDASGHVAEETKNARVTAGKGILYSAIATGVLGFITAILFLFCTPNLEVLFSLDAPQPFVQLYALALGKKSSIFMTAIAVLGLIFNTSIAIVAASRLVYAVARDGVLPLSGWIGQIDAQGQPKNAVTVIYVFAATILCTILPSQVAFTSLVSAGGVPTIAAYGLIAVLRLVCTPDNFKSSYFYLGRFAKPFYVSAAIFNALIVAVMLSPFFFPVSAATFNFACVIFGSITVFGVLTWYFTPAEKWLRREHILQAMLATEGEPMGSH